MPAKAYTSLWGYESEGETHLYRLLKEKLPSGYHIWHKIIEPQTEREIGFVVLHPTLGMRVIEVADWTIGQLSMLNPKTCAILINGVETELPNPVWRARENCIALKKLLAKEPALRAEPSNDQAQLAFSLQYVAVFTKISQDDLTPSETAFALPDQHIITSERLQAAEFASSQVEALFFSRRGLDRDTDPALTEAQITFIDEALSHNLRLKPLRDDPIVEDLKYILQLNRMLTERMWRKA